MWKSLAIGAALAAMATTAQAQAQAQTGSQCNKRDSVLNLLASKYSESPVAIGVTNNGGLVEVLRSTPSAKEDTWTIIVTSPQGVSCLVAAGEGWRDVDQLALDPET